MLSSITYKIKLLATWKIHQVFHAEKLMRYTENDAYGKATPMPPPVHVDGEEEYEVEAILNKQTIGKKRQYLVKWKRYPLAERTWEPAENLTHAQEALVEFRQKQDKSS